MYLLLAIVVSLSFLKCFSTTQNMKHLKGEGHENVWAGKMIMF